MNLTPGSISPDGRWRWDGVRWVPAFDPATLPAPQVTNPWAIASLVSSLVVPLIPLSSLAGIVFGAIALSQIGRSTEFKGKGLAVAGIVISSVAILIVVALILLFVAFAIGCRNTCFT